MRTQFKKALSFLLVFGILAGSLIFPSAVLAQNDILNVTLNTNGGKFVCEVDSDLTAGEALPTAKEITRTGCIFAGWYDNADLTGSALTAVPADATGNKTYYAKWLAEGTMFDDFDGAAKAWGDWNNGGLALNNDAENSYSGNSEKVTITASGAAGYLYVANAFPTDGDGISLWIKTATAVQVQASANYSSVNSSKFSVPAGEGFVFIPWTALAGVVESGIWTIQFTFYGATDEFVYVDNIGTYKEMTDKVYFRTDGGVFTNDAPITYFSGMALPTSKDIKRDNCIFAGWYDNAELTGAPVTAISADATGSKTYYAKWVVQNTVFDSCESDTKKAWDDWDTDYELLTLNTNADNLYSGSSSIRGEVIRAWNTAYLYLGAGMQVVGDGIALWVKSDSNIEIDFQFNYQTVKSEKVAVPAGEGFVFIPWDAFTGDLSGGTWTTLINVYAPAGTVYYLDEIGTYKNMAGLVSFNANGGVFANNVPSTYYGGMALPTAKEVTRTGYIFAGWYENAEFTGTSVATIPTDAVGAKTYYAKWVVEGTMFDDFDGAQKAWGDWNNGGLALNTDAANAYSGNSEIVTITASGAAGYLFVTSTFPTDGDGITLWVKTKTAVQVQASINYSTISSDKHSVPAGEGFVFIPWTELSGAVDSGVWTIQFTFYGATNESVYVDNIGTYSEISYGINFNTGNGEFVTTAPTTYTPGMALPNYEDVANDGFIFAGWYNNADFTGVPVYSVPANAEGDKTYYAKWVKVNTLTYNFDTLNWVDWSVNTVLTHNTDSAYAYSGNTSMKYEIAAGASGNMCANSGLMYEGNGVYFWIKADKEAMVHVQFKANGSIVTQKVTVCAGENLVALPWPANITADTNGWVGSVQIIVAAQNEANTIYIDDVGTYIEASNGISFETNGGSFVTEAPTRYVPGMILPDLSDITKAGYIFAGWYDNADFNGTPVISVPNDAVQDVKYYAKWAVQCYVFEDFNDGSLGNWEDYTTADNLTLKITDGALEYTIPNKWAGVYTYDSFEIRGDGICILLKTDRTMPITVSPNLGYTTSQITVPSGESYVFIPWSTFGDNLSGLLYLNSLLINFPGADGATVYIDNIGTYSNAQGDIAFEIGCGSFVNEAPTKYTTGMTLPSYKDVTKGSLIFAGWYDNAEFAGTPVYSVPNNASGSLTYYAKWVKQNSIDADFEDITLEDSKWSDWSAGAISINTDATNAYKSSASLKYEIPAKVTADIFSMNGLMYKGDGISFWVKAEKAAVLYVQFSNNAGIITQKVQIAAGENFVVLSWPENIAPDANGWVGFVHIKTEAQLVANTLYIDNVGTFAKAGEHAFNEGLCEACGTVAYDFNGDNECDIRDLVTLKNYLVGVSDNIDVSYDDDCIIEEADLVKVRKQILGLK